MCPSDDTEQESKVYLQGKEKKKQQAKNILSTIC